MSKKTVDEVIDAIDPVETPQTQDSPAKAKYRKIIEEYKVQNPVKYEMKKAAMEAKLNSL